MCYFLCVLRWLMRPNLAPNCLLQIEREVWGRKLCWWCLSSGFPLCTFLLGFARIHQLPFLWGLATLFDPVQSVLTTLLVCWKPLREALRVSLYRFFWPLWSVFQLFFFFGNVHQVTWPVHLNCANFRRVCTLHPCPFQVFCFWIPVLPLIFRSFLRQLWWKWFSLLACRW